jgi:hypothetical protein
MTCDIKLGSLQIHIDEDKWLKCIVDDKLTDVVSRINSSVEVKPGSQLNLGKKLVDD